MFFLRLAGEFLTYVSFHGLIIKHLYYKSIWLTVHFGGEFLWIEGITLRETE